jgi:hypothetical protein
MFQQGGNGLMRRLRFGQRSQPDGVASAAVDQHGGGVAEEEIRAASAITA